MKTSDERILAALMASRTIADAASRAGVSERTIYARLASEDFKAEYDQRRRAALDNACRTMQTALADAVDTLTSIMQNAETAAPSRVSAARAVLEYGLKLTELTDLAARVAELEKIAKQVSQ